jgi:hypothetical protein
LRGLGGSISGPSNRSLGSGSFSFLLPRNLREVLTKPTLGPSGRRPRLKPTPLTRHACTKVHFRMAPSLFSESLWLCGLARSRELGPRASYNVPGLFTCFEQIYTLPRAPFAFPLVVAWQSPCKARGVARRQKPCSSKAARTAAACSKRSREPPPLLAARSCAPRHALRALNLRGARRHHSSSGAAAGGTRISTLSNEAISSPLKCECIT